MTILKEYESEEEVPFKIMNMMCEADGYNIRFTKSLITEDGWFQHLDTFNSITSAKHSVKETYGNKQDDYVVFYEHCHDDKICVYVAAVENNQ